MSFALTGPVSHPLILTVVVWAVGLFLLFGLMSRANPMTIAALAFGSFTGTPDDARQLHPPSRSASCEAPVAR